MHSRDDLVSRDLATQLERTCRTTVGDTLRSITYFTPSAYQQVYLRNDLEPDADLEAFAAHEAEGFRARETYQETELGSELGDYRHTIRSFERGYVTRVTTDAHGTFVTTGGLTMRTAEEVAVALGGVLSDH